MNTGQRVILHIPHSSINIPFFDGYIAGNREIKAEQLLHTDWYTDDLFQSANAIPVIADFSRVFCDVERFEDDAMEVMAVAGMGVLYEKKDNGERLRTISTELRKRIINGYYKVHHRTLSDTANRQVKEYGSALIIDCHSFSPVPFVRDLDQNPNRPSYNIGTDPFHTPGYLIEQASRFFEQRDASLGIDWPYSGSIVPTEHFRNDKRVQTIMLEINRKLYLEERTNIKSSNYDSVKNTVSDFIEIMFQHFLHDTSTV